MISSMTTFYSLFAVFVPCNACHIIRSLLNSSCFCNGQWMSIVELIGGISLYSSFLVRCRFYLDVQSCFYLAFYLNTIKSFFQGILPESMRWLHILDTSMVLQLLERSKQVTINLANTYFILIDVSNMFLQFIFKLLWLKIRYKYYKRWITTREDGNVQSHDQYFFVNSGAHTFIYDKILKGFFNKNDELISH